ncbi:PAS domain S-box protein [Desulfovibrio aerotolerans]|uniref:histidine kinase n=1 Tax=Solidesulfovibrio aerotolerans TaxID=295255 RepID=A0A7C9MVY1_9BACT|nr:PAS domain S-box protein [Solidesulfovibrio aerotolerans]MYL83974.1 PAS domain S-box protein [Solidesulfovibrio aerotolerans]
MIPVAPRPLAAPPAPDLGNLDLAQVLEHTPAATFVVDTDFVLRFVNRAYIELHDLAGRQCLGRPLAECVEAGNYARFHAAALAVMATGAASQEEIQLSIGGRERCFLTTRVPLLTGGVVRAVCGMLTDITDHRRTERELRASHRRYAAMVEDQTELVVRLDPQHRRVFVNQNLARLFGEPPEVLLGGFFGDRLPEAEASAMRRRLLALTLRSPVCDFRHEYALPSGETRRLSWTVRAIFDEAGRIGEYQAMGRDVSAVWQMERELSRSEAKYRDIFEHSAEGIFQFQANGAMAACNPALARILGYASPDEVMREQGDLFQRIEARPEDRLEFLRLLAKNGRVYDHEMQVVRRDGRTAWLSVNARAVLDGEDRLDRVEGAARDITDRKRAEGERMLLVSAVDQSAEGLVIVSRDFRLEYANPAFDQIVGGGQGTTARGELESRLTPFLSDSVRKMLGLGLRWSGRVRLTRPEGEEVVAEAFISPVRDGSGIVVNYILLVRDMTYELGLERRLRQAEKLEAIGVLAGGVAHDFNNILTPILLNTEMILSDMPPDNPLRQPLGDVVRASERARDLVRQLLTFSRQGERTVGELTLGPLVKETVKLLRGSIPAGVELSLRVPDAPLCVTADPTQMHQVLTNLCLNAAQAMPGGGVLEVGLAAVSAPPRPKSGTIAAGAPLARLAPGQYARLWVSDVGHGMPAGIVERIFEPFFTTKKPGQGTGMGLAAVHGIVKSYGGAVLVSSAPGQGSLFEVYLPLLSQSVC